MVASTWLHSCIVNKILPVPLAPKEHPQKQCQIRIVSVDDAKEAGLAPENLEAEPLKEWKDSWEEKHHCVPVQLIFLHKHFEAENSVRQREAFCKVCANKSDVTS